MRILKPRVLNDIQPPAKSVFDDLSPRVNLSYRPGGNRPFVAAVFKFAVIAVSFAFLFVRSASAPIAEHILAQTVGSSQASDERKALEAQLKDLETQMDAYQNQILGYQKQGNSLKGEINQLNGKISQINIQISAINLTLKQLDRKIVDTASQIKSTESTIASNQQALSNLLRELYMSERANLLEIFLQHPRLSDFFGDVNSINSLQNDLRLTIVKIHDLRVQLEDQQGQLAVARADAASVKEYRVATKSQAEGIKNQKNYLLSVTKGQESKYQALLKQTKETAAQIRSRIFELLGGGELSFEQAYSYAKLASDATGVRPALILAVLDRESALGQNVGRCGYQTAMSPQNRQIFLVLVQQLNISPDSVTVSCPNRDGIYGGAMGPAQFVPATWNLYADRISKITGRTSASPWNNADAFVATALYLRDAGASGNPSVSEERKAAARYYAGSNWYRYRLTYGQAVINLARKFQQDIETITGMN